VPTRFALPLHPSSLNPQIHQKPTALGQYLHLAQYNKWM
jgi:hypothetical protein